MHKCRDVRVRGAAHGQAPEQLVVQCIAPGGELAPLQLPVQTLYLVRTGT